MKEKEDNDLIRSLQESRTYTKWDEIKKWIPSAIILALAFYFSMNRGTYGLLDNIDLVIHEAGHLVFFIFGRYIYTLGGTLMQIILPSLITWYFFRNSYRTGIQFGLLWLGQNFINISVYAADARARKLPLLGGNNVYHDWNYLLGEVGLLNYDIEIGYIFFGTAILIFIVSVIMPLIIKN
ncbi:MAG: hypothetical protein HXY49_04680 [Ignavibacteriaceae bacterium]|nr:hypothetical protein [Ignavibacteriaceae bacterium]